MEIIIRENDSLPIYEQIVREVKKAIIKKEIMPGDMMPSIRALARDLENSVITTKRAYDLFGGGKRILCKSEKQRIAERRSDPPDRRKDDGCGGTGKGDGSVSSGAEKNVGNVLCGRAIVCLEYYNVSMWRGRIRDLH